MLHEPQFEGQHHHDHYIDPSFMAEGVKVLLFDLIKLLGSFLCHLTNTNQELV